MAGTILLPTLNEHVEKTDSVDKELQSVSHNYQDIFFLHL